MGEDEKELQPSRSGVPRFASFKPRQAAPPILASGSATASGASWSKPLGKRDNSGTDHDQSRQRRNHQGKYGRLERAKEIRTEPSLAGRHNSREPLSRACSDDIDESSERYFTEDRKCDQNNTAYGTLHRYAVPRYREAGGHRLLGLPRHFKAAPELQPGGRLITAEGLFQDDRRREKSLHTSSLKESGLFRIGRQARSDAELDARRSYLPLATDNTCKRRARIHGKSTSDPPFEDLSQDITQYNLDSSEGGQLLENHSTSSDPEPESASTSTPTYNTRERHAHLSRLVNEDPGNVEAWLALIQHQDVLLVEDAGRLSKASTSSERHGLADIRLSLYQKALSKTEGQPLQYQLVLGMMTEGAKVWDTKKLAKRWKSVVQDYPDIPSLWVRYLNFYQTSFVTFTYGRCQTLYKDCLDTLAKKPISTGVEGTRIYVFLRMTAFMHEAGFSEHAHALWQAILEYCFYEPGRGQARNELHSFEDFWESEVPRLGDEGARGWRLSQREHTNPRSNASVVASLDQNLFKTWNVHERHRMSSSSLPAKTLDHVDEEDPYRVILFHDIQPFLYRPSSAEAQQQLLEAFLIFCGLPPLHLSPLGDSSTLGDPFLNNFFLDSSCVTIDDWLTLSEQHSPYDFPLASFVTDTATLFARAARWFDPWKCCKSVLSNQSRSRLIQNSLRQLLTALPEHELFAEYVVAFEQQLDSKEARKYAKGLLKRRSSIRLYNSFALLECSIGNFEAAERVWSTALSMSSAFSKATKEDTILIWRSWLWAVLDQRDFSKALMLCLSVSENETTPSGLAQRGDVYLEQHSTRKLRARQHLTSHLNQNLSLNNADLSIHYLDVLTILTYLTSDRSLAQSLTHYKTALAHPTIAQSPPTLCLLHQSRARLLHLHGTSSPSGYRPSDITIPLADSIRLFPNNTIFLSLYHLYTRRSLLIDRLRDNLSSLTDSPFQPPSGTASPSINSSLGSIIPPVFRIYAELNRPTYAGSTSHSVRSVFENAVSFDFSLPSPVRYSAAIWKLYVRWEIHVASKQAFRPITKAEASTQNTNPDAHQPFPMERPISTFHRAIRACPWSKELYMLAFSIPELRDAMQEQDLRAVYDMMEEKELRIHVEIQTVERLLGARQGSQ